MLITREVLENFSACSSAILEFENRFPEGLDVSGLWDKKNERDKLWRNLLFDPWLGQHVGWAIRIGLIPARITANLRYADLRNADLYGADLHGANLTETQREYAQAQGAIL